MFKADQLTKFIIRSLIYSILLNTCVQLIHEEEQRQRKEKLVKLRLDERERERKKALEFKRKEQAAKRYGV